MILYTVIIAIIIFILIMAKKLLITLKIEQFNTQLDVIKNVMSQLDDRTQSEKILSSVDKSINTVTNLQGKNVFDNMKVVDKYINDIIINDTNNSNKILEEKKDKLPTASDYNLKEYNHKLNIMKIRKEIKQQFLLGVLKSKLLNLVNNTLDIDSMKKIKLI